MWRVLKGLVSSSFFNHNPSTFCVLSAFWYIAFRYLKTVNPTVKSSYHNIDQIISKQFFSGENPGRFFNSIYRKSKNKKKVDKYNSGGISKSRSASAVKMQQSWKRSCSEVSKFSEFIHIGKFWLWRRIAGQECWIWSIQSNNSQKNASLICPRDMRLCQDW